MCKIQNVGIPSTRRRLLGSGSTQTLQELSKAVGHQPHPWSHVPPAAWCVCLAVRTANRPGQTLVPVWYLIEGPCRPHAWSNLESLCKNLSVVVIPCHSLPSQSKIIWSHFLSKLIIWFFLYEAKTLLLLLINMLKLGYSILDMGDLI